jgi:hypothetical protein
VIGPAFSGGNLTVYASNCKGNSGSSYQFIDISDPTSIPCNLNGPSAVCAGFTYNYTVGAAAGNVESYVWTVPDGATIVSGQGTTSVYISFQSGFSSGSISVVAANCIVNSPAATQSVCLATQAPSCSQIGGGPNNVCIGSTETYTVQWINGATAYTWTVPANTVILSGQGSTTISLQFNTGYTGGTLSVIASNCIGSGTATTFKLTHNNCGVHDPTSIDEAGTITGLDVLVYPNPFRGQFFLKVTAPGSEPVNMKIFDITGRMVEASDNIPNAEEVTFGERLQAGIYLIQVQQGDDSKVLRIIKAE